MCFFNLAGNNHILDVITDNSRRLAWSCRPTGQWGNSITTMTKLLSILGVCHVTLTNHALCRCLVFASLEWYSKNTLHLRSLCVGKDAKKWYFNEFHDWPLGKGQQTTGAPLEFKNDHIICFLMQDNTLKICLSFGTGIEYVFWIGLKRWKN